MVVNTTIPNYFQNATTFKEILQIPNYTTEGMAWFGLLFMVHIIIVMSMLLFGVESALLASAFISLIAGMFLVYLDLIGWQWLMIFFAEILLMIIYKTYKSKA
jgi:hypothetical protein